MAASLTSHEIQHRLRVGLLHPEFRSVYRIGPPTTLGRYMAAVKACGPGAVLSGLATAWLLGLIKGRPPQPEVTASRQRSVKGLKTRCCSSLRRSQTTLWRGIPVTSPAQTLIDIAAELAPDDLARACHEAGVLHHTTPRQVDEALALRPNSPGAAKLRAVMRGDTPVSLSRLESRFIELIDEAGLQRPCTNRVAGTKRVDCRWENGVTVELDSYRFHNSRYAWEQDRKREREARAREDVFCRFSHDDVFEDPGPMLAELRELVPAA